MNRTPVLIDTNVLIGIPFSENSSFWNSIVEKYRPCICLQNLCEFLSVATRSKELNGLDKPLDEALELTRELQNLFSVIPETASTADTWSDLCRKYQISGRKVHDARLAATALSNGVEHILTDNAKDFNQISEIKVLESNQINDGVME